MLQSSIMVIQDSEDKEFIFVLELLLFHHQKEECDNALQRLDLDAFKDKFISMLAERRANNINWR